MSYVSYDVMIHWHMGVPRGGTEGRSEEHGVAEERGDVLRPERRRAVFLWPYCIPREPRGHCGSSRPTPMPNASLQRSLPPIPSALECPRNFSHERW